jgi:DNA-binding NarL/FixJ family response regulator
MIKNKLVIADDHPIFRKGLIDILRTEKSFRIIGEAADGNEALELIIKHQPDVAVLDVDMPQLDGIQVCKKALEQKINTRFVILTMHKEEEIFNEALNTGVSGYVLKDNAVSDIIDCIKTVAKNETYISPDINQFLVTRKQKQCRQNAVQEKLSELTASETRILKLIADNKSTKEIADMLFVSYKTIENHRSNICRKMGLEGNNALLKFIIENSGHS